MTNVHRVNGEITVTVIDLDMVHHERTLEGGSKTSAVLGGSDHVATVYSGNQVYEVDPQIRDQELRSGDTVRIVRRTAKPGSGR